MSVVRRMLIRLAVVAAAALSIAAHADGVADCEQHAMAFGKKHGWSVTGVKVERGNSLMVNRYDDQVGRQRVSTEYMGFVHLTRPQGTRRARFICLHEGDGKKAVYFGVFSD